MGAWPMNRVYEKGSMARYREPWCERCGERPQTDSLIVCAECARETAGVPGDEGAGARLRDRGVEDGRATVLTWRTDPGRCAVCGVAWGEHEKEA